MDKKKLKKVKIKLERLRQSPHGIKASKLVSLAMQLGRHHSPKGKEPAYVRQSNPSLRPLTIPGHRGDLKVGTARSIIDALLSDVDEWEQMDDEQS